jgi:hypothetical protein
MKKAEDFVTYWALGWTVFTTIVVILILLAVWVCPEFTPCP